MKYCQKVCKMQKVTPSSNYCDQNCLAKCKEIAFFLLSFLEKQRKFFSNEKNHKNRYEWRFEVPAKQVAQIRHECNGF